MKQGNDVFSMPTEEITQLVQRGIKDSEADSKLFAPIPSKMTSQELEGKTVYVLRKLQNRGGDGLSPGTIATIKRVVRGQGITIETEKCPCCGQYAYITGVKRNDLSLVPDFGENLSKEEKISVIKAFWELAHDDL